MLERLRSIGESMSSIFRHMFVIAMYLGVLLSLFAIHRYLLLGDGSLASHIGFSFLNAWALAKVILIGQELRIGDSFRNRKLIYVIVVKSAIFSVLLLVFRLIEEAVIGAVEGKGIYEAIFSGHPGLEHNKFQGMLLTCLIMFFALMPFFAYLEFERVLGEKQLRDLLFGSFGLIDEGSDDISIQIEKTAVLPNAVIDSMPEADVYGIPGFDSAVARVSYGRDQAKTYKDAWFYEQAGEVMGPTTERELIRLLRRGAITPQTLVHNVSISEEWRMVNETALFQQQ